MDAVLLIWFGLPFLPAAWVLGRGLARRWTTGAAATALTPVVVGPVLWAANLLALDEQDFLTFAVSTPNLLPPRVVTIGLLTYSVLTFGAHHAAAGGGAAPRAGRVLLHLGGSMLLLAAVLASVSYRLDSTGQSGSIHIIADERLKFFIFFLGPPYLVWRLWRRGSSSGAAEPGAGARPRPPDGRPRRSLPLAVALDYLPVAVLGAGSVVFLWYVLFT